MSSTLDLKQIQTRLASLQQTSTRSNYIWKPSIDEEIQIRIIPYKFNRKNPFIELNFHYSIGSRYFVSPTSFGKPDPIVEFAEKLRDTGDRDNWSLAKKLQPKLRTFAPIIVRGQEHEGVKFWGFGKTVYQELLGYMVDKDYGDITDPISGRDIVVKQFQESGKSYPTTNIRIKPNVSMIAENQELLQKLYDSQVEITEVYTEKTYEELHEIFTAWMTSGDTSGDNSADNSDDTIGDNENVVTSQPPNMKLSQKDETSNVQEISDAFQSIFANK